jgi:hypothetical protein
MALISCPECNSRISDRAEACPKCGFPLTTPQDLTFQFADHQWLAVSAGLAAEGLEISASSDGSFLGVLRNPSDDLVIRPQRVNGRWQMANSLLLLSYPYFTASGGIAEAEFLIQLSVVSEQRLSGVDKWLRSWEFERRR